MSPASTSTHSPASSPSTPRIGAPPAFSLSRTWLASALTCRSDSALAMISVLVETGQLANVEDGDVAGLDVFEGGDGGFLNLVKSHPGRRGGRVGCGQYRPKRRGEANRARRRRRPRPRASSARIALAEIGVRCDRLREDRAGRLRPQQRLRIARYARRVHSATSDGWQLAVDRRSRPGHDDECARPKISRQRCHVGSPRKASPPTISASGRAGGLVRAIPERHDRVALGPRRSISRASTSRPGYSASAALDHREPMRGRRDAARRDAADRPPARSGPSPSSSAARTSSRELEDVRNGSGRTSRPEGRVRAGVCRSSRSGNRGRSVQCPDRGTPATSVSAWSISASIARSVCSLMTSVSCSE